MQDPQYKGNGFYDIDDVESVMRAIQHDAGGRLYNSIQVSEGKQDADTASVERDLHNRLMMQHRYIKPFETVDDIRQFIADYKPKDNHQDNVKAIMESRIGPLGFTRQTAPDNAPVKD